MVEALTLKKAGTDNEILSPTEEETPYEFC